MLRRESASGRNAFDVGEQQAPRRKRKNPVNVAKAGLAAAKRRGVKLGGWTAGSERSAKEAAALAERMRPVMAQLAGSSAHKAAAELNRRKIASATGGKWYAATVIKLRDRLEA